MPAPRDSWMTSKSRPSNNGKRTSCSSSMTSTALLLTKLTESGDLTDEVVQGLKAAISDFKAGYKPAA